MEYLKERIHFVASYWRESVGHFIVMKKTKFNNLEIFLYYFLEKIAILSKDIVRIFFFFFF